MFALDEGSGSPVLLLHGVPSTIDIFDDLRAALSRRHRVVTPELPGYGRSAPLAGPHTYPGVRAALEDMLLDRGTSELAIVGFSGGAYRALELAVTGRLRVRKLVLLGAVATLDEATRSAFRELAQAIRGGMDVRDMMPGRMLSPASVAARPDLVERVRAWATIAPPAALAAELEATADIADLRPQLSALEIPVLLRVGELDAAAPPSASHEIATLLANATMEVVAGCAHALLYEDAATVAAIERFVAAEPTAAARR